MGQTVFFLRSAADSDAEQIHALMRHVYGRLEDKSLYVCDDLAFVKAHIHRRGFAVMACTREGEPAYRGNGLQCQMIRYAEESIDADRFRYFMATVSPDNPASCRSLEKLGYAPLKTVEKYGGLARRVYCKKV